jgi:hypothetical protein
VDQLTQTILPFMQLFFYAGLLAIFVGLPVIIWLWVRFMRDIHSISESLHWIAHCTQHQPAERHANTAPSTMLSAFGR